MEPCYGERMQREARRRLALLGPLATSAYDYHLMRERSRQTWVPAKLLWRWWNAYQQSGLDGLLPVEWTCLDEETEALIAERERLLGEATDAVTITPELVTALAERNAWSPRTAERWLRRYQAGGWWSLAPKHDPAKPKKRKKRAPPQALGALDDAALEETFRRRSLLGDLTDKLEVSRAEIQAHATEIHMSTSTLWHYLQRYRAYGLPGLAPQIRSDKGGHHGISPEMEALVRGVRFSQPGKSVRAVHEAVCERARALGEEEPSRWQVRAILAQIPKPEQLLADRCDDDFRGDYEVTRRMEHTRRESHLISYQIDHTLVDVLVQDLRSEHLQTPSKMIRPWLTLCIDSRSRLVMAAVFAYDRPDRHTVATAIREAVLVSESKPYGGIPHEIWVDNGKELLSHHVEQLTQELHIMLQPCAPHRPQQKGIVERFFGTLNTRLWSTLPGYVASNVVERDPNAKAKLTLAELEELFWDFIDGYHRETHSQTEYWNKRCYAEPADPRLLDILLKEPTERKVFKDGIHHDTRIYWHAAFATMVDERVLVREEALYRPPDEIEVFSCQRQEDDEPLKREWICTAIATDSVQGQEVTRENIIAAKHEQRKHLRQRIQRAREAVASADREIAARQSAQAANPPEAAQPAPGDAAAPKPNQAPPPPTSENARPRDLLERLAEQEDDKSAGAEP
jgi:putative transposase